MAFDSTIRLKQLNQGELSGFVSGLISLLSPNNTSGNIIPSVSGIYTIGSTGDFYSHLYTNTITLPQNSGMYFGNTFFNVYTGATAGFLNIGGYTISSSNGAIYIQGPSGATGSTGVIGPTGVTGISITGAFFSGVSSGLVFQLSNNVNLPLVYLPVFTGASGVSVKSFTQSGNSIYPNFSNNTTGVLINLPTGIQGPIGLPGTVLLDFISGSTSFNQVQFPSEPYLSNYFNTQPFPALNFMRGMSYTFTLSGLNTHRLSALELSLITGIFSGIPNVGLTTTSNTAYYVNPSNTTGYWRFAFFPATVATGIYSGEWNSVPPVPSETTDITTSVDIYRSLTTFNIPYTAQNNYNYGFSLYGAGDTSIASGIYNSTSTGFAIVCGNVIISSGVGPQGIQGIQGIQGASIIGPQGLPGYALAGVTGAVNVGGTGLYFQLINNGITNTIPIPTGGPVGPSGIQGLVGGLTNYFEGVYNNSTIYSVNDTVSRWGSTYIYTGSIASAGNPPENGLDWQLLAQSGAAGAIGATGAIAPGYSSSFFVVSGFPTGAGTYVNNITGITVNGVSVSGTGAQFTTGQIVSFHNSGLIGFAYTPFQQIVVSTHSQPATYVYGTVNSYNSISGILSFTVMTGITNLSGIPGTTINGTEVLWYNYNNATINLGANLAVVTGAQGIQGPSGQASLLRQSGQIIIGSGQALTGQYLLDPTNTDCFNIIVTGVASNVIMGAYQFGIDFNWAGFPVGKAVLLKVRNSGVNFNGEPNLFIWTGNSVNIQWPNGIVTWPAAGQIYIYSILRFMNEPDGTTGVFGTYSNPYQYNNFQ